MGACRLTVVAVATAIVIRIPLVEPHSVSAAFGLNVVVASAGHALGCGTDVEEQPPSSRARTRSRSRSSREGHRTVEPAVVDAQLGSM